MKTLRKGDHGGAVETLQTALNAFGGYELEVDGDFGEVTEEAVEHFQELKGVVDDGVVGRVTWGLLGVKDKATEIDVDVQWIGWQKVQLDEVGEGYGYATLRKDCAERLALARMVLVSKGAKLSSSGGRRRISKTAKKNQATKSFHYTGRAIDLWVYGGMQDPETDPFVVVRDPADDRLWIVYARCEGGEQSTLTAWCDPTWSTQIVTGTFVNVTKVLAEHGFQRIRARRSYAKTNYGASEWWHFQDTTDLVVGESTFGEELLKVWKLTDLKGTSPWQHRDAVYGVDWN